MPIPDQEQIAESVKQGVSGTPFEGVTEDGLERVRRGWQDHGYFNVQVTGEASILTSRSVSQFIALSVQVDEGSRYNLGGIAFKNNKAISNVDALRGLFPIADGEIFSREKIATGLENLKKAYGELGYINFTSVPDTKVDDENNLVSLDMDMDEGKQFRVSSFDVLGLDDSVRTALLKDSPVKPGQVFRKRDFDAFLEKHISLLNFHPDEAGHVDTRMDEHAGTIAITINAAPCVIR
jgi:outer membrane protein insertion porin family